MSYISEKRIYYVNSANRTTNINSSNSDFDFKLDVPDNSYSSVVVLSMSIPLSYYLVQNNHNTFQLQEGTTSATIAVQAGNYSATLFAQKVSQQMTTLSPNHWAYTIQLNFQGKFEFKVTGTAKQVENLTGAFEELKQQRAMLNTMIVDFDKQKESQDDCIAQLKSCARKLHDSAGKLEQDGKDDKISTALRELLENVAGKLEDIESKEKFAEFSSFLKYAQIYALKAYDNFVDSLANV
jgi:hypothetical protein